MAVPKTLYDKIIDRHRVCALNDVQGPGERLLLYVDRTVLNEYTSPQAFSGLRAAGRTVWRPRAALGVVAVIVRQEVVVLVMGGIFVLETASVILQVASFKLRGKRIFRMAPIHHH